MWKSSKEVVLFILEINEEALQILYLGNAENTGNVCVD